MTKLYEPVAPQKLSAIYQQAREALLIPKGEHSLMQGFPPLPNERVTRANWTAPPFSQWGFRHASRLLPTATVFAGEVEPSSLPEHLVDLDDFRFLSICGEQVTLAEHLHATCTDGFLVMREGEVLYERYFNGQRPVDRHVCFSMTQVFVGTLAEEMIYRGVLNELWKVSDYLPDLNGSAFADATVRDLLDMAVGIDYREDYIDPLSDSAFYCYASGILRAPEGIQSQESLYDYLMALRKKGNHGGFFHYVTANSEVLAWVMERVTGLHFHEMVQQLWRKLRCDRDGYFISDPCGRGVAGAGFSATLRDVGRFGTMIADYGKYQGRHLLPQKIITRIAEGGSASVYAKQTDYSRWTPGGSYRSQWYVFKDDGLALMGSGIHGQYLYVDLSTSTAIVKLSSHAQAVCELEPDTVRLMRALGNLRISPQM